MVAKDTAAQAGSEEEASGAASGTEGAPDTSKDSEEAARLLASFKEAGIADPKGALETIKKLREFERGNKLPAAVSKELEELRAKVKETEDAKKTDLEKLQGALSEAEAAKVTAEGRLQEATLHAAVAEEGRKANALYPGDLHKLIEPSEVEYDKAGEPKNLEKLIEALKASRPALFSTARQGSFDGGVRTSAGGPVDMNQLIRQKAARG